MGVSLYSLHHNEDYYPDPFDFIPDRFLPSSASRNPEEEASRTKMRKAFVPFIVGARSCAGKAMAYAEVSIVVAKTLWYFDFESAPGELGRLGEGTSGRTNGRHRPGEYQLWDCNAAVHDGPNLIFRPRKEAAADLET